MNNLVRSDIRALKEHSATPDGARKRLAQLSSTVRRLKGTTMVRWILYLVVMLTSVGLLACSSTRPAVSDRTDLRNLDDSVDTTNGVGNDTLNSESRSSDKPSDSASGHGGEPIAIEGRSEKMVLPGSYRQQDRKAGGFLPEVTFIDILEWAAFGFSFLLVGSGILILANMH